MENWKEKKNQQREKEQLTRVILLVGIAYPCLSLSLASSNTSTDPFECPAGSQLSNFALKDVRITFLGAFIVMTLFLCRYIFRFRYIENNQNQDSLQIENFTMIENLVGLLQDVFVIAFLVNLVGVMQDMTLAKLVTLAKTPAGTLALLSYLVPRVLKNRLLNAEADLDFSS